MKRLTLKDWAAIAEIIGTIAVVVSLLFVGYTIEHNSQVIQASSDNFLYDADDRQMADLVLNRELSAIATKFYNGEELSNVERFRYNFHMQRQLSMWELAFDRYKDGFLSERKWNAWDRSYSMNMKNGYPKEWWANLRDWYTPEFAEHVDAIY